MKKTRILAAVTSGVLTVCTAMSSGLPLTVFAGGGAGGYTWEKTDGYQEATTKVTDSNGTTIVAFEDADDGTKNQAGFCTMPGGEDWSDYTTLTFDVTNNAKSEIVFSLALGTGASWDWWQANNSATISAGETTTLSYYLNAEEWSYDGTSGSVENLFQVQRINMMIAAPYDSGTVSGEVVISNLELGGSVSESVEPKDGFYVDGSTLRDANQNAFIMRGTNYAYDWYSWDGLTEKGLTEIKEAGANTVRIVLSNGVQYTNVSSGEISNLISICEKLKLVCILEVHDATGNDSIDALKQCAQYWVDNAKALKGHEDTVIINIANEWMQATNDTTWTQGYTESVKMLRDAGLTHCILIDAGGYGQGASTVLNSGSKVLASDPEKNCMFAVHMYSTAGGTKDKVKSTIDGAIARNLCLSIAEFGWKDGWGTIEWEYIMEYCQEVNTGWLSWSWYGNSGGQEYLDMVSANAGGTVYNPWGSTIIDGDYGWKATSQECSVFSGEAVTTTTTATTTVTTTTTTVIETIIPTDTETTTTVVFDTTTTTVGTMTTVAETTSVLYGDINLDGVTTAADIVTYNKLLSDAIGYTNAEKQIKNGDLDLDGSITAKDSAKLLKFLSGAISYEDILK